MFKYSGREDKIYVFSLDHMLADDVRRRIVGEEDMQSVEVIVPNDGEPGITTKDVQERLGETTSCRLLILDVRSITLPPLQESYNRLSGFNRADLNERCFTLCIGDGPRKILQPEANMDMFARLLARMRLDYGPAMYFYDPFLQYTREEMVGYSLDQSRKLPKLIPQRFARAFEEEEVALEQVREYFRGEGADPLHKDRVKRQRAKKLARLVERSLLNSLPGEKQRIRQMFTNKGLALPDETLSLSVYPLFFEHWVRKLLEKARGG